MKKEKKLKDEGFKFKIGDKCFILGHSGVCIITGRGKMNFISGGELNMYQIDGGHTSFVMEQVLLSMDDVELINKNEIK